MRLVAVLVGLVAILAATGCTSDPSLQDTLLTRSSNEPGDEMSARMSGTLTIDLDRGCVLLSGNPVVWPAETTLDAGDPSAIHLPSGAVATEGDTVSGGGGEIPAAVIGDLNMRFQGDVDRALACAPTNPLIVFTTRDDGMTISEE